MYAALSGVVIALVIVVVLQQYQINSIANETAKAITAIVDIFKALGIPQSK